MRRAGGKGLGWVLSCEIGFYIMWWVEEKI